MNADAATVAPVMVAAPHCPACCPIAHAERDGFDRGYELGRPRAVARKDDDSHAFAHLLLLALLTVLAVKIWRLAGEHAAESHGEPT